MKIEYINNEFLTCKICNKTYKSLVAIAAHISGSHKLKTKDYYDKFLKQENEGLCLYCNNKVNYNQWSYRRFCNTRCKDLYYYSNEENLKKHREKLQSKEIRTKISNTLSNYFNNSNNSAQIKKQISDKVTEYFKNPKNREKTSKATIKAINEGKLNVKYKYDSNVFQSSYELCFYVYLKDHNITNFYHNTTDSFEYTVDDEIKTYIPDFKVFNTYVELKGLQFFENKNSNNKMICPYHYRNDTKEIIEKRNRIYEAKHQCMIKNHVKIITNCDFYLNYVENKYGKDFIDNCKIINKVKG